MRIKRTKTGEGGPDGLPASTRVHYAKRADGSGCVVEWVRHEADAADFDEATAASIFAHYAARPRAGTLEVVGAAPEPLTPVTPRETLAALDDAAAEVQRQRARIAELEADVRKADDLSAEMAELARRRGEEIDRLAAEVESLKKRPAAEAPPLSPDETPAAPAAAPEQQPEQQPRPGKKSRPKNEEP